ncbi:MAG TPA: GNAT family protein [Acidimicrobiales bacterium]|jgi:RimJ/RimL family protein N-acetyltransferase|nr:GNAT family protein [Acidimicrobiales bacterium]
MVGIIDRWPLYGLRLRTENLELRLPTEADLVELSELTREPLHDPSVMPFGVPWTDEPVDTRMRSTVQWHYRARGEWSPDDWKLELVVVRDGRVVGTQGLHAHRFAVTREVSTGSWVGRAYQGQGIATGMRRAVLDLAFTGLGALTARSGAFSDNRSSLRVSEKVGYRRDGTETHVRRGERAEMVRFLMTREDWRQLALGRPAVTIEGLDACRADFGLPDPD